MPSTLPDGDPVPVDGALPDQAHVGMAARSLSFYVHVPFCATRCGYCDFNTYTAGELGSQASPQSWLDGALAEIDLAARVLRSRGDTRPVGTVFVGGGTPSLVGAGPLTALLRRIDDRFGLTPDAEVSTEANPESTDPALLDALRAAGYTRLSLGMQSSSPRVLQILDRRHTAGRPEAVVAQARAAGFDHVNLDLIYGTPGETDREFADSLAAAVGAGVDHVSAYSLIVEPGTRMHRQVRTGALPMPDEDILADRYLMAEAALTAAGMSWYEVSNWATDDAARCRHNLAYWTGGDWWGIGPGAHSHVGGVRWWNVKHPAAYAAALAAGRSPGAAREVLSPESRELERVLLELRLADGLALDALSPVGRDRAAQDATDGLLDPAALSAGRAVLTLRGRLLADGIALALTD
ncbi:coproporphyrinogen III oxidase [Nakamurella flavida]|uniref:Heme chaperone HemW n=1 Tax=Nakamurella flavida TaxID=363630 RepID=A0A939C308_9ACTN|nr:radical SAM family heme chaperone HemW [Nakamurella flavida]MBM9477135.1 coproporphyrinogen III oxidase [Nakamurella flavida]MDP9780082.1 oxygen-independent coproporphyrinogen-3 oxidase [Nakamurella flavida]